MRCVALTADIPSVSLAHRELCRLDDDADRVEVHRSAFGRYRLDQCSQRGGQLRDVLVCQTRPNTFVFVEGIVRLISLVDVAAAEIFRLAEETESVTRFSCQCDVETPGRRRSVALAQCLSGTVHSLFEVPQLLEHNHDPVVLDLLLVDIAVHPGGDCAMTVLHYSGLLEDSVMIRSLDVDHQCTVLDARRRHVIRSGSCLLGDADSRKAQERGKSVVDGGWSFDQHLHLLHLHLSHCGRSRASAAEPLVEALRPSVLSGDGRSSPIRAGREEIQSRQAATDGLFQIGQQTLFEKELRLLQDLGGVGGVEGRQAAQMGTVACRRRKDDVSQQMQHELRPPLEGLMGHHQIQHALKVVPVLLISTAEPLPRDRWVISVPVGGRR